MLTMGIEGRKWELFTASIDLFAEGNFNSVSVRDIARMVGLQPGGIYHYFASKEEILATMFEYDSYVSSKLIPVLDSAVQEASDFSKHPLQPLYKLHCHYSLETRIMRNKITTIAFSMIHNDLRAEELILRNLVNLPRKYDHLILNKLIELDRIEPLNIEVFSELHANHILACTLRGNCRNTISTAMWYEGLKQLFSSMITLKETSPPPLLNAYFYYVEGGWM